MTNNDNTQNVFYKPYQQESINIIYNLLFCDSLSLFKNKFEGEVTPTWKELFSEQYDLKAMQSIAMDDSEESRIRILAYNILRSESVAIIDKRLLGVVIEVGLEGGLDVIAAYPDGRARYINQSEKLVVIEESQDSVASAINNLIKASENVVSQIGPWDEARLAPPETGLMRMTFLVSDGLYFGQAPMNLLQTDSMGGPVVNSAIALLNLIVNETSGD